MYNREGRREGLERVNEGIREGEEGNLVIAGDFNARTGEEGGWNDQEGTEEAEEGGKRRSKDEVINKQGRELMRMLEERGWFILNGGKEGDEKGEWTYEKAGGKSVIDYGIVNWEAGKKIGMFQVGCRIESDHQPLITDLGKKYTKEEENIRKNGKI